MEKYKVIALNVTGAQGVVHYAKEELTAAQLGGEDRAKSLVKQDFIELVKSKKVKAADLIALIEKAESAEQLVEIVGEDKRPSVTEAADKKLEELTNPKED